VTPIDACVSYQVLRRAGVKVTIASIEGTRDALKCAQDTVIVPDISISELSTDDKFDVVIVPGGDKGVKEMSKNLAVGNLLQQHYTKGKLVAAICAGRITNCDDPSVLPTCSSL
jgi:putative intracellular protease/amidase